MKVALLLVIGYVVSGTAWAEGLFFHKETGIELPATMAGLSGAVVKNYEFGGKPAVAVEYSGKETEVTVYIRLFDADKESTARAIVEMALVAVREMEAKGTYSDIVMVENPGKSKMPGWATASFTGKNKVGPMRSFIFATIKEDYSVKVRYTTTDPKDDTLNAFMAELQKVVRAGVPKS
ncbi:hypothetical protein BH09VER1_BH09VER1_50810 [soil metagenome]